MATAGVQLWSTTAASNATADPAVNWAEGQAPSTVNNSARALMASVAGWRNDISGTLTSGGTATAYTLTTASTFASLSAMDGAMITFKVGTTNGASVTLAVDGLAAKAIVTSTGVAVPAGALVAGSVFTVTYVNSATEFRLHDFFDASAFLPAGMVVPYAGTTAPTGWLLCYGQSISSTTYAALFSVISTTYGNSGGAGTFDLPDLRGRVVAGQDDMGGSSANRLADPTGTSSLDGDVLGDTGGAETTTLATTNLPAYTPAGSVSTPTLTTRVRSCTLPAAGAFKMAVEVAAADDTQTTLVTSGSISFTGTAQGGAATPISVVQPTIILNYIIKA